ncbi:MAG: L-seryl-tRNA(Sec) selenium transferase [Frankiales bacterium]|nr:L-seryl-tRNA(Sec) selenium transferase [Frankiales bacterium]
MTVDPRRQVPRADAVLADPRVVSAVDRLGRSAVKAAVDAALDVVRRGEAEPGAAADLAVALLPASASSLRPVLNATGVVLHTNLGRAPLSAAAVDALVAAAGYVDVEYDVDTGARARRGRGAVDALTEAVPSAEAAHVVNNGAAALVLAATALAASREIVVSRGELVEIGDGFRLPDLLMSTGARLREVGTTNRTKLSDYADAIDDDVAFVLKVHPSNFVVTGFTSAVPVGELATLGRPVVVDIGSGLLRPDPLLTTEPDATTVLRDGAALVTASGDKLLGGPQAGLVLGRRDLVDRLRTHPLARALRVDKLTLAALEATVRGPVTPTAQALHLDTELLRRRAVAVSEELAASGVAAAVVPHAGVVGGGGAPGVEIAGWAVALDPSYAERLRLGDPCIVGVVDDGRCLLDLRCVPADRDRDITKAVVEA